MKYFYGIEFNQAKYSLKTIVRLENKSTKQIPTKEIIWKPDLKQISSILNEYDLKEWGKRETSASNFYSTTTQKDKYMVLRHASQHDIRYLNLEKLYERNRVAKEAINRILFNGKNQIEKITSTKFGTKGLTVPKEVGGWLEIYLLNTDWESIELENNMIKINKQNRKLSKEFGKYLTTIGMNEKTKDKLLQELSKAWGKRADIKFIWSTKPSDFMRQSLGTSWNSCHRIYPRYEEERDAQGNSVKIHVGTGSSNHPWLHHSLDMCSTILILTSELEPRIQTRIMIHVDTNKKVASIGRAYPDPRSAEPAINYAINVLEEKGFTVLNKQARGNHGATLPGFGYETEYRSVGNKFIYGYKDFSEDATREVTPYNSIGVKTGTISEVLTKKWEE